jgi:hypothetical protein
LAVMIEENRVQASLNVGNRRWYISLPLAWSLAFWEGFMRGWPFVTSNALMAWPLARPVHRRGAQR